MLILPQRTRKPRKNGITAIHDIYLTVNQTEDILTDYGNFLDIAKLGVGTAYVTNCLEEKIAAYRKYAVEVYFGGTLFEKFYSQGKVDEYSEYLTSNGIATVEISTGTIDISLEERVLMVKDFSKDFTVFSEVGRKDVDAVMAPSTWITEINALMDAGAAYVITEGRNSATAGIYRPSGEMRTGLIEDIISNCNVEKIIFEAPTHASQMYFINKVGCNVNLGNLDPKDLLHLETQRLGLRSETFSVTS